MEVKIKNQYDAGYMMLILEHFQEKGVIDEILPLPEIGFETIYCIPGNSIIVRPLGNNMYEYEVSTMNLKDGE